MNYLFIFTILFFVACYKNDSDSPHPPQFSYVLNNKTLTIDIFDKGGDVYKLYSEIFLNGGSKLSGETVTYDSMVNGHITVSTTFTNLPIGKYVLYHTAYDHSDTVIKSSFIY